MAYLDTAETRRKGLFKLGYWARRFWGLSVDYYDYEKRTVLRYIKTVIAYPFKIIGYRYWANLYDMICKRYSYKQQEYAGVVLFGEGMNKELFPKELFEKSVLLPFEDSNFFAPAFYDKYLKQMYGNYMQLPPEAQRVSKHGTAFYDSPAKEGDLKDRRTNR